MPHHSGQLTLSWLQVLQGWQMQAVITEAISPSHFWVQVGGSPLQQLMERLNVHISSQRPLNPLPPLWCPNVGTVCAACYSVDRLWYRAKAMSIISPAPDVQLVHVLYVDYGNMEEVLLTNIRPLDHQFLALPAQAMLCRLSGVQPVGPDPTAWSNQARSWFVQIIAKQTLLVTVVKPAVSENDVALVELHTVWGSNRLSIGNMMININLAIPTPTSSIEQVAASYGGAQKQSQSDLGENQGSILNESTLLSDNRDDAKKQDSSQSASKSSEADTSSPQSATGNGSESLSGKVAFAKHCIHGNSVAKNQTKLKLTETEAQSKLPLKLPITNESVEKSHTKLSETEGKDRPPLKLSLPSVSMISTGSPDHHRSFNPPLISCEQASDIKVIVSHVQNPGRFYVHIIGEELKQFNDLMVKLNEYYSHEVVAPLANPTLNEPCAVMFRDDRHWCRAVTVGVQSNEVCVHYVDYGCREWISPDEVYPLPEAFLDLPKQAVECTLAGIFPHEITPSNSSSESESEESFEWLAYTVSADDNKQSYRRRRHMVASIGGTWQKTASELFEKLVGGLKILFAKVEPCKRVKRKSKSQPSSAESSPVLTKYRVPSDLLAMSPKTSCSLEPILHLHLYDTTTNKDVYINQSLVDAKYADSLTLKRSVTPNQEQGDGSANAHGSTDMTVPGSIDTTAPGSIDTDAMCNLEDVFDNWDPRKAEYESVRNTYQLNPDDTNVALHGYERKKDYGERGVCHFFSHGCCRRGSNCPFRHVNNDETVAFWSETSLSLPTAGSWVPVVVTAIAHPHKFWVQLPQGSRDISYDSGDCEKMDSEESNGWKLAELMDSLQKVCSSRSRFDHSVIDLSSGEWVCACSQRDKRWYRAMVIDGSKADGIVKVFWVDYGDYEYIPQDCLLPMQQEFQHLPRQSVECQLEGLAPTDAEWSENARELLQKCTAGKLLCAHVSFRQPDKLLLSLFDTSEEGKDASIAELLIEAEIAKPSTDSMLFEKGSWMIPG
jgi:hypothetical protein